MSNYEGEDQFKFIDIPEVFHSDLTSKPFEHCVKCEKELLISEESYMIEKAVKEDKEHSVKHTIFEYAMCMDCAQSMSKALSKQSMINLNIYYQENVDFQARKNRIKESTNIDDYIQNCLIHNKPIGKLGEYQIYAECVGGKLVLGDYPFMIRGEAVEELIELLSAETLDELDNFKEDITSGPPEFREILDSGPRVLI